MIKNKKCFNGISKSNIAKSLEPGHFKTKEKINRR